MSEEKTIASYFREDHRRLERIFTEYDSNKTCNLQEARRCFSDFRAGLERHITWEEAVLFPVFESKTLSESSGPTRVMRLEHRQMKGLLEEIQMKLRDETPEVDAEEARLLHLLGEHNQKEEKILYPMIDQLVTEEERKKIFEDIEHITFPKKNSSGTINYLWF